MKYLFHLNEQLIIFIPHLSPRWGHNSYSFVIIGKIVDSKSIKLIYFLSIVGNNCSNG